MSRKKPGGDSGSGSGTPKHDDTPSGKKPPKSDVGPPPPKSGTPGSTSSQGPGPLAPPPKGGKGFQITPDHFDTAGGGMDKAAGRMQAAQDKLSGVIAAKGDFMTKDSLGAAFAKIFQPMADGHGRAGKTLRETVAKTGEGLRQNATGIRNAEAKNAATVGSVKTPGSTSKGPRGGSAKTPQPLSGPQKAGGSSGGKGNGGRGGPPFGGFRKPYDRPGPDGDPPIRRSTNVTSGTGGVSYEGRTTVLGGDRRGRHDVMEQTSRELGNNTLDAVRNDPLVGEPTSPGMAGAFHHEGVVTSHTSMRNNEANVHPAIQALYDRVPPPQGAGHGQCAEVPLMSDRLWHVEQQRQGLPPLTPEQAQDLLRGGEMTTHVVNHTDTEKRPPHGTYEPPCRSCTPVLSYLGIRHVRL